MKADRTVRLLKHVPGTSTEWTMGDPAFATVVENYNKGWELVAASNTPDVQYVNLEWNDTIDISGLTVAELSLINQGGAVAFPIPPASKCPESTWVHLTTYVSTNPVRGTFAERLFAGNALSTPGESQDWFLATAQTWSRDSTGSGILTKIAENNWGTGTIASSSRLYVRVLMVIERNALYNPGDPTSVPIVPPYYYPWFNLACNILTPPMSIALSMVTADLDAVATAAAIMRGNELQQTYDN
jgi:hypothetical protein